MGEGFESTACGYQWVYELRTQISCLSSRQHVLTHVIAQQLWATLHMCTNVPVCISESSCKSVRRQIHLQLQIQSHLKESEESKESVAANYLLIYYWVKTWSCSETLSGCLPDHISPFLFSQKQKKNSSKNQKSLCNIERIHERGQKWGLKWTTVKKHFRLMNLKQSFYLEMVVSKKILLIRWSWCDQVISTHSLYA